MNILVLCTYPVSVPRHGGQLRVANILDAYRKAGHSVAIAGVLGSEVYEGQRGFAPFPGRRTLATVISNPFLMEDYAIGRLFSENDTLYNELMRCIEISPDIVHVEQPWLFSFARRFVFERAPHAKIIYGSQNIESLLKAQILKEHFWDSEVRHNVKLVESIEQEAILNADGIICVSELDAMWLQERTQKPVLTAPNGVNPWKASSNGINEAKRFIKGFKYSLYCASAHPPNVVGFFSMLGGMFGSLTPDQRIIIAGGAGPAIAANPEFHKTAQLPERTISAGMVSQECLEALLDECHAVILPLTQGGGTNLKTAEALWSGKHVVATSVAMRGFESFIGAPGVHVADDPSSFKRAIRIAMSRPELVLSADEVERRSAVLWANCLKGLASFVRELV